MLSARSATRCVVHRSGFVPTTSPTRDDETRHVDGSVHTVKCVWISIDSIMWGGGGFSWPMLYILDVNDMFAGCCSPCFLTIKSAKQNVRCIFTTIAIRVWYGVRSQLAVVEQVRWSLTSQRFVSSPVGLGAKPWLQRQFHLSYHLLLLSVYISVRLGVSVCVCVSGSCYGPDTLLSVCVCLSVCFHVSVFVCLSISLSVCLCV